MMQVTSDLATFFSTQRSHAALQHILETSSEALTSGTAPNKARHLSGDTLTVSLLDRKSTLIEQQGRNLAEASLFAKSSQLHLESIKSELDSLSGTLSIAGQISDDGQLGGLIQSSMATFGVIVSNLNGSIAGRHVFSGTATNVMPLPSAELLLEQLEIDLSGLATANDVILAVEDWFNDPGGYFLTTAYRGSSNGAISVPVSEHEAVSFTLRADDVAMRKALASTALGAIAGSSTISLSHQEMQKLLVESHTGLLEATHLALMEQGALGVTEDRISRAQSRNSEDAATAASDRLTLVQIDQFEEVSRLENAQQQLEILYRIGARRNVTSFAEYLR